MIGGVEIRPIRDEDAASVALLCGELGYPVNADVMHRRLALFAGQPERVVLVALLDNTVVGWIDVGVEHHLQEDPKAIIGGLVVTERVRGAGVGLALLHAAEEWARRQGFTRMRVRSNAIRERAHRFYLRDGYARVKTSAVFEKTIGEQE